MIVIHKFEIEGRETVIHPQGGASILDADFQGSKLCVWAMIDDKYPAEQKVIEVLMTGEEWNGPGRLSHIATRQRNGIVVHVFERKSLLS